MLCARGGRTGVPVSRELRGTRAASIAFLANGKITELLGAESTGDALSRCIDLAGRAEVYDLAVPRALDQLDVVTSHVLAWHNGPSHAVTGEI